MQRRAERQRRHTLLPALLVEMRHSGARRGDGTQRRLAGGSRRTTGHGKNRQHAVADEFQDFAAKHMNRAGDAIEPGIERRDHGRGRMVLGQLGEAAQIGKQQRRRNGLADIAPQGPRQHPRGAAPAEIGLERRLQRAARGNRGKRRGGKARGLAQRIGLDGRERTRPDPAEQRSIRL